LSKDSGKVITPPTVPTSKPPPAKPPIQTAGVGDDSGLLILGLVGAALVMGGAGGGRRAA
jgi:hypothetical protein